VRILLACQQSPHDYPIPAYKFWRQYFVEGLKEGGHEVIEVPGVDWARGLLPLQAAELSRWRDETWSKTLTTAASAPGLDLFLTYLYPQQIETAAIKTLRARGLPVVNFYCDNVREFRTLPESFAAFDLHWVPEHDALPLYAKRGWRTVFAPMPCWVPPSLRQPVQAETSPPTFIGSSDAQRQQLFADAFVRGASFELRGRNWSAASVEASSGESLPPAGATAMVRRQLQFASKHGVAALLRKLWHQVVPTKPFEFDFTPWLRDAPKEVEEYSRITREASICIGVNRFPSLRHPASRPGRYSRLRDIEAPMLGACYLTEWAPELPRLYEIGTEIEVYHNADELVAQLKALSAAPSHRRALRVAGQQRALRDHSVERSFERIVEALGLRTLA
jgi:hypothetical protein